MATLKILFGSVALLWLVLGTGCRNPNSCNSPWRPFAQNAIIAPPATNSLNMSGQSGGYYNPSATAANPQGNVPANPQGNAPNSGWAPAPNNRPSNQPTGNGNFGFNGAPMGNQNFQTVTSSTMTNGSTQVISPDFYTTRTDERRDPSRMPVADATGMRAPSSFQSYGSFHSADQRNQPNGGFGSFVAGNPYTANQGPTVLARASTAPETNPNYQNGWRPNPTNGPQSFNR